MRCGHGGGSCRLGALTPRLCGTGCLRNPCARGRSQHSQALTLGQWTGMRSGAGRSAIHVPTRENTWVRSQPGFSPPRVGTPGPSTGWQKET